MPVVDIEYIQYFLSKVFKVEFHSFNKDGNSVGQIQLIFATEKEGYPLLYYFGVRLRQNKIFLSIIEKPDSLQILFDIRDLKIQFSSSFSKYNKESLNKFFNDVYYDTTAVYLSCQCYKPHGSFTVDLILIQDEQISQMPFSGITTYIHTYEPL